jgi:hypothetical protein
MSMTQEEIEALMNDTASEPETNDNDILAGIDGIIDAEEESEEEINVDDMLAGIEGITDSKDEEEPEEEINVDDMLAGIEGITDSEPEPIVQKKEEEAILPLPSSKEHKIVNQLNEVAEDTEEKASQIFDVLSYILDENEKVTNANDTAKEFILSQIELLEKLSNKFPNIEILKENLEKANEVKELTTLTTEIVNEENNKIFEAMEIMQYHDINRQKIERVMAVIRKLTQYLNGIFEDDSNKPEVQIAKHISGDGTDTVDESDIDSLISEFSGQ